MSFDRCRDLETPVLLAAKVAFLKRAHSYPEPSSGIVAKETHMSWVFLTDGYAYKLKKPVRYPFLDFSTLDARRRDCEAEVRLNRRLTDDVYLGIEPLTANAAGELRLGKDGRIVDWLVKMRRLPDERSVDALIKHNKLSEGDVTKIARFLTRFYQQSRPIDLSPSSFRQSLERDVRANEIALKNERYRLPGRKVERLSQLQRKVLNSKGDLFDARAIEARIVEGHGDLRPEHVYLNGKPQIIDCLEFKEEFRHLDPVDELTFFAMECERLGAPFAGPLLLRTYTEMTGDRPDATLIHFYRAFRACLRAKIAVWHLDEPDVRTPHLWRRRANEYLALAERSISFLE